MKLTACTRIRSNLETVWNRTQVPDQPVRWDIRFTHIDYLPKAHRDQAQRFRHATRIGFGMRIDGEGETIGHADQRGSALRFWSEDPKSLIREGSGGWTYKQDGDHVHFATVYDYEPRYGLIGQLVDSVVFRPLTRVWRRSDWMGKATGLFLRAIVRAEMLFPETGVNIPFELENAVFHTPAGETFMRWTRTFRFPNVRRRFEAVMRFDPKRGKIVDWLGKGGSFMWNFIPMFTMAL